MPYAPPIAFLPNGVPNWCNLAGITGVKLAASTLVTGAIVPVAKVDPVSIQPPGVLVDQIILRTTAAITGFTAAPIITVGWDTTLSILPIATGVVCPTDANVSTKLLPPALMPYGAVGAFLNVKVTNTPLGTGNGFVFFDIYCRQA